MDGGQAFEVNRRVVLASRNIGVARQGLAKFAGVMNMLPPMNENSYRDHVSAVCNAAQTVATKSMTDAAEEAKQFCEPETDGIFNIGVWRWDLEETWLLIGIWGCCSLINSDWESA